MATPVTVDHVIALARKLSPLEKLKIIEELAPDLEESLAGHGGSTSISELDAQYQRGYEQFPESTKDVEGLLPHLPLSEERWE